MWERTVLLKDHAPISSGSGHRFSIDKDFSLRWLQKSGNEVENRRFAASRRADHGNEFALIGFVLDLERYVEQGGELVQIEVSRRGIRRWALSPSANHSRLSPPVWK